MHQLTKKRPVSMKDVALHLGVSKATVSRALSGKTEISSEMRRKIRQASERLGYRLNPSIQDLVLKSRNGNTRNIGFVLVDRDFSDPAYTSLMDGIAEGTEKFKYNLMLVRLKGTEQNIFDLPPLLRDGRIDAILISGNVTASVMDALKKLNIEIMVLGIFSPAVLKGVSNVQVNIEKMAYESVELVMQTGCRRIALFEEAPKMFYNLQIYNYIKAAAEEYKIEFKEDNFYQGTGTYSGVSKIMKPVLRQKTLPFDCIICWDYRAAEELAMLIMMRCGFDAKPDLQIVVTRPYSHFKLPIPALYLNSGNGNVALQGVEYLINQLKSDSRQVNPIQIKV